MIDSPSAPSELVRLRDLGRGRGLAAGLAAVLAGLDPAREAPGDVTVLPADGLAGDVSVLPHPLAALEGLALVRFPPGPAERPSGLTGARSAALAAVRAGVLDRLLDAAVERLETRRFAGLALIDRQLVAAAIADVAVEIELSTSAEAAWAAHERLTEAGWAVARLFGAEGFTVGHPARALHLSALVADLWVARPAAADAEE